ncbi:MAG: FHA domain-containing protein, partial [Planctomycetia bacterium]|nr:FHA domain-containing protein [Planctomycetia bacterium]
MIGYAWLTLRQIRESIKLGRLEEAAPLLQMPEIRTHRQAGELFGLLARAYVERGERALSRDDTEAAWSDLQAADALDPADKSTDKLRRELIALNMAELRALLSAGELNRADDLRIRLRQRGVRSPELLVIDEGLQGWMRAIELADLGEMAQAIDTLDRTRRLLGVNTRLDTLMDDLNRRRAALPSALAELHRAAGAEQWADAIVLADAALALAPQHAEARALRHRAWRAVEPATIPHPGPGAAAAADPLPLRFFLWVDGVGGYLVCLSNRLTFGQATAPVDIPLVADVSRHHAGIQRDAEGYVLEAIRSVRVNDQSITRTMLNNGDEITLGATCRLAFRLPVAANHSARLDSLSGRRLPVGVDSVFLMAETLIMGNGNAHV